MLQLVYLWGLNLSFILCWSCVSINRWQCTTHVRYNWIKYSPLSLKSLFVLLVYHLLLIPFLLNILLYFHGFITQYQHDALTNLGILLSLSYIYFHILYYAIYLLLLFILYYTFSFVYIMSFYYFVIYDYYFYIPINFIIVYFLLIFNLL